MGLLHATVLGCSLSGGLGANVLSWSLATSVLSSSLLCSSHVKYYNLILRGYLYLQWSEILEIQESHWLLLDN